MAQDNLLLDLHRSQEQAAAALNAELDAELAYPIAGRRT
jgi:hypothetical protein